MLSHPHPDAHTPQPELSRLLYPLLIYCYLDLVGKGATAQAHKMMTKAQRRFAEGQPQGKGRLQVATCRWC